jgi:peptide/nickel transport system substrate-binding protein
MNYKHLSGPEGNELIPDLAAEEPDVSEDGLTYTFTLRDGVEFGPPVNREVTSRDVAYAFERIGTESLVAQYGFYYDVIEGMAEFKAGKAKTISGIKTPDDKTISFTLTEPTGDFVYRMAMPASGPIPEEVAKCFTKAGEYGRYVIATGPYMLEGSEKLDISTCKTMRPIAGFNPTSRLSLVRNPNYDPATDTKEARENFLDGIEYTINSNAQDIFNRITAGDLDGEAESPPPEILAKYARDDDLTDRMKVNVTDTTLYLTMNLTQPPFDDVHVRKAANWVIDKSALRRAAGGPVRGEIAHHIVPDTMFNDALADYKPYGTSDDAGDAEKAKEEMRQSRYDTDRDGVCDAAVCKGVLHLTGTFEPYPAMAPIIERDFAKIGIEFVTREVEGFFPAISNVRRNVPFASATGWIKDYADPSTFMVLFDSRSIVPEGNINNALVGLRPEQAKEFGVTGKTTGIPSVDADVDACKKLTGDERLACWGELDRKLMEEVVPWVPFLTPTEVDIIGPAVTKYEFDQFAGATSFVHTAVDPSKQE